MSIWRRGKNCFSHTYVVHSCLACKQFSHSAGSANWSLPFLLCALALGFPFWIYSMVPPLSFPWYQGLGFFAVEMLFFYVSSFLAGFISSFWTKKPASCPFCHAPLSLNGSYYKNDEPANREDILIFVFQAIFNVGAWIYLLRIN